MEVYTSDSSDTDSREQKTLDYSRMNLTSNFIEDNILSMSFKSITTTIPIPTTTALATSQITITTNGKNLKKKEYNDIEICLINHNQLNIIPPSILKFFNLKILDLSNNQLNHIPDELFKLPLNTLIIKNNYLTNESLPKTFILNKMGQSTLKELNLSGNMLNYFPDQLLELNKLKYLYLGGNKIQSISKDIWKMNGLQILSIGGNLLTEVPESVGSLNQLKLLVLSDNQIECLPSSIAGLENLKSLKLHKNQLRHLPKDIVALKHLTELSLRDNPLVVRFVQDMALNPPTLMELAARMIKVNGIKFTNEDLPRTTIDYLNNANCCVNPQCKGVFFDNRVEHIKFVDFCGKYRVPLLQYLCSSKCIEHNDNITRKISSSSDSEISIPEPGVSGYMMRKVLLG